MVAQVHWSQATRGGGRTTSERLRRFGEEWRRGETVGVAVEQPRGEHFLTACRVVHASLDQQISDHRVDHVRERGRAIVLVQCSSQDHGGKLSV